MSLNQYQKANSFIHNTSRKDKKDHIENTTVLYMYVYVSHGCTLPVRSALTFYLIDF